MGYFSAEHWCTFVGISTRVADLSFIREECIAAYVSGQKPELNETEISRLSELTALLRKDIDGVDIHLETTAEIDLNIANLSSQDSVLRYLRYLDSRLSTFMDIFKDSTYYTYLGYYADQFHMTDIQKTLLAQPFDPANPSEEEYVYGRSYHDDPLSIYIRKLTYVVGNYEEIQDYLTDQIKLINPKHEPNIEIELTANTHKLLLFHKLGMLEPLYTKYRSHIGVVRFAKLIGTLLGIPEDKHESFRKSLDDFITETFLKPGNKKTVGTPAAERKVDAYLTEIGLTNT
jgi:hypothetical protein